MKRAFLLVAVVLVAALAWIVATGAPQKPADGVTTRPTRTTGLYVETQPAGASVGLGDKPVGKSHTLLTVSPGRFRLTVTLDGHVEKEQTITILEGRITRIEIELEQEPEPFPDVHQVPAPASEEPPAVAVLKAGEKQVTAIALSPDGRFLASCCDERTVRLWDVAAGEVRHFLDASSTETSVKDFAFSPDGTVLATCAGSDVMLWDVTTGEVLSSSKDLGYSRCLAFSPDGKTLAVCDRNDVLICDVASLKPRSRLKTDPPMAVWKIAYCPEGKMLAATGGDLGQRSPVILWSVDTGRRVVSAVMAPDRNHCLTISPDGKILATRGKNDTVVICRLDGGGMPTLARPWKVLADHKGAMHQVSFSTDGNLLACAGGWSLRVSPGRVTIWDTRSATVLTAFEPPEGYARCLVFSADGKHMAYTANNIVKIVRTLGLSNSSPAARATMSQGHDDER